MNFELAILNVLLFWILTTPHEFAHAWAADRLGDDTPRRSGRLTLHPLAHIDWIGTVLLPCLTSLLGGGFLGWGKPVATDPARLRGGMRGLAVVALAGPASNIVLALLFAAVSSWTMRPWPGVSEFAARGAWLSIYLAVFNLLPVPPLDGSKLLLAARVPYAVYAELARFGFLLLIVAMSMGPLGRWLNEGSLYATRALLNIF